ncbi:MAG: DinB family protein [Desulfovibrio sp.]|jgi:hypothetical protein|nr:DinB family protein [Desulfovibrio sp.]
MSTAAVESLKAAFLRSWGLTGTFITVCPDHLWTRKFGGWPVWQSVYHSLMSVHFFVRQEGAAAPEGLYSPQVTSLGEAYAGPDVPSRQDLQTLHASMETVVRAYLDGLTDADLAKPHEGLSARTKMAWTHASACAMLVGHGLYHLGTCDAALREEGLKGVF